MQRGSGKGVPPRLNAELATMCTRHAPRAPLAPLAANPRPNTRPLTERSPVFHETLVSYNLLSASSGTFFPRRPESPSLQLHLQGVGQVRWILSTKSKTRR